jgi:hypothetical protein
VAPPSYSRWRSQWISGRPSPALSQKPADIATWRGGSAIGNDRPYLAFVEELKQRAHALVEPTQDQIRTRAWEIWEENGRPTARDEEFWFQAEREFREAEELAKPDQGDA